MIPVFSLLKLYTDLWRNWSDHSVTGFWMDTFTQNMLRIWFLPNTLMVDLGDWEQWWQANICRSR